ncbi:protocatechuate 3,4-dioxygenase, alpha subunit [Palleronia marisminoris]|uniref:Protocatechuate 3,4-dioxygenase alpha chain n=1 Tax=Palleronia marisminoris TaxID=315423 RepID=A0A1Y5RS20_9RHOB|nr:protocatechuate 3,4-dioxygenase subunit alpha [Palleronia marisminoris]SFG52182.1 protocatechuate 3,4-dioxygenase, alpha subunit [Palleronia marisminoris]SLN24070.1 Protocatechuate 3,4-dioxygenase alpha chain [Palleronia marisminoris]
MPLEYPKETPSQTAGPFVHIGMMPRVAGFEVFETELGQVPAAEGVPGTRITIEGRVLDGTGTPIKDALLEIWHADAEGRYAHPEDPRVNEVHEGFTGFGRCHTDLDTGTFTIETIKPGVIPGRHARPQAPHLNIWIVARGINIGLHTRMYFPDEENDDDPLLGMVEHLHRRATLVASATGENAYRFDIHLQGPQETVFLDI